MIIHSPESPMPEPYKTYVSQRAANIAKVLEPVVRDTDVQLCSRAITKDEQVFDPRGDALVYGCVVDDERDGLKTALYTGHEFAQGIAAYTTDEALRYAKQLLRQRNHIRIKDPRESDGDGQFVATTLDEVETVLSTFPDLEYTGVVLMPDFESILGRYTAGRINLGEHGKYNYYGSELVTPHQGRNVFGGGDILVAGQFHHERLEKAADRHHIPAEVRTLANKALDYYARHVVRMGRASVDVIHGITHNGSILTTVVDPTPRVGGHTGAETLAIAALKTERGAGKVARASGRLLYNPKASPQTGTNFVDTPSLVINAQVTDFE